MSGSDKPKVLVVVQQSGGNDFMNTIVPYSSGVYHDARPAVGVKEDAVLPIDDDLGFHPSMGPLKELYDKGKVAVVQGIGYPDSSRSHFRAMDIMHTCETETIAPEGWLGKAMRELDPRGENVLTGVSFGTGLPRAMSASGVPVTSVSELANYGILSGVEERPQREQALDIFRQMYAPAVGSGVVMDYLAQVGDDVLKGADLLKPVPAMYSSEVEYADSAIAKSLRDVAKVHLADLGTRIFYAQHGGYDTHANQLPEHPKLLGDLSTAIMDFLQDLRDHNASDEVVMLVFTEFGRRMLDNGSGTDHGSGGGAFIIGDRVKGGLYSGYPPLERDQWLDGEDLQHTHDFRGVYGTLLEQWLGVEARPIVGGSFEQLHPFDK